MIKTLEKLIAADPRFHSYSDERASGDGIWLYCVSGYWCPDMECGTIHERTVVEVMALAKTVEAMTVEERIRVEGR